MGDTDDAVWARVLELMPVHACGNRLRPGGTPEVGHVLVCPPCSHVEAADPAWEDDQEEDPRA